MTVDVCRVCARVCVCVCACVCRCKADIQAAQVPRPNDDVSNRATEAYKQVCVCVCVCVRCVCVCAVCVCGASPLR